MASRHIQRLHLPQPIVAGLFIISSWLLTACAGPIIISTPPSIDALAPPLPEAIRGEPAEALAALIQSEREASIDRNLALLAQLWAPGARIVDGRNTSEPGDDYIWAGREAIMDRYVVAVFPVPPPPLNSADLFSGLTVMKEDERTATGMNGGDQWRLIYEDDRWWLQELVYQQP